MRNSEQRLFDKLDSLVTKARKYYDQKIYKKAIKYYKKAINYESSDFEYKASLYAEMGWSYYYLRKYRSAINSLHRAIEINKNYENIQNVYLFLAHSYYSIGDFKNAVEMYYLTLKLDESIDKEGKIHYWLGVANYFLSNFSESQIYLSKFLEMNQSKIIKYADFANYYLGLIFHKKNNFVKAKKHYNFVLNNSSNKDLIKKAISGLSSFGS